MVKYQYHVTTIPSSSLDEILNKKGNQGWRLISIVHNSIKTIAHTIHTYECVFEKIIV